MQIDDVQDEKLKSSINKLLSKVENSFDDSQSLKLKKLVISAYKCGYDDGMIRGFSDAIYESF